MAARPQPVERQRVAAAVTRAIDNAIAPLTALQSVIQTALLSDPETLSTVAPRESGGGGDAAVSMRELIQLLENSDMRATEVMAALQQQWGMGPKLRELDEAVSGLDFERALGLGKALLEANEAQREEQSAAQSER